MRKRSSTSLRPLVLVGALALFAYLSLSRFAGAGRDDVFFTLWSGENLAHGYGLINYNFERAEIDSSLLHTWLVALLAFIAPHYLYLLNKVAGGLAGAGALGLLFANRTTLFPARSPLAIAGAALLMLATLPAFLYWNLGGLETPFQTVLLLAYGIALIRYTAQPGAREGLLLILVQCLYITVRAEGFAIILFSAAYLWLFRLHVGRLSRAEMALVLAPLAFFGLVVGARYLGLGLLMPVPVYAKVGELALAGGAAYLWSFYTSSALASYLLVTLALSTACGVYVLLGRQRGRRRITDAQFALIVLTGMALFVNGFVLFSGGDWMEYHRFVVPALPLMVGIAAIVSSALLNGIARFCLSGWNPQVAGPLSGAALLALAVALALTSSAENSRNPYWGSQNCSVQSGLGDLLGASSLDDLQERLLAMNCAGRRDRAAILPFIKQEMAQYLEASDQKTLVIVSSQMGFFPYMVRHELPDLKIRFIDSAGISEPAIALMPLPKNPGGVIAGANIVDIVTGELGILSDYANKQNPNMLYLPGGGEGERYWFRQAGYRVVWDQPGALVLFRNSAPANTAGARHPAIPQV